MAGAPALRYSLAWLQHYWAEEERLLGPDAWAYGLAKNRRVVETLSRYLLEQGLIEEIVPVDELFFHDPRGGQDLAAKLAYGGAAFDGPSHLGAPGTSTPNCAKTRATVCITISSTVLGLR